MIWLLKLNTHNDGRYRVLIVDVFLFYIWFILNYTIYQWLLNLYRLQIQRKRREPLRGYLDRFRDSAHSFAGPYSSSLSIPRVTKPWVPCISGGDAEIHHQR